MPDLTPEQRSLRARAGAYAVMAKYGREYVTRAARAAGPASDEYWIRTVDPDQVLADAERQTRAEDAKRSYFAGLALRSARARSKDS